MKKIKMSVIICTYNPDYIKLIRTINSILNQDTDDYEIIITDDGSQNNYFIELRNYFNGMHFSRYVLTRNSANLGTVKNLINGINHSHAELIKPISPGDYLYNTSILKKLINYMIVNQSQLIFGKAIYYSEDGGKLEIFETKQDPQDHSIFFKKKYSHHSVYKNYTIYRNRILGASIAAKKSIYADLLDIIEGHIKYAEDMIVPIAAVEHIKIDYFDNILIWYEYGNGISTNGEHFWNIKGACDYNNLMKLLLNNYKGFQIIRGFWCSKISNINTYWLKTIVKSILFPDFLLFKFRKHKFQLKYDENEFWNVIKKQEVVNADR